MATSNKIVDTRRLAAKGRFGDTEMRNVRGKPSHVTALEAYNMDTVGVQPSASNKSINPMTGLPEYYTSPSEIWDKTFGKEGLGGVIGKGWEWLTPSGGTEWFGRGPSENVQMERQSKGIMTGGMENLQTQYGQYMGNAGPDGVVGTEDDVKGFIEREQDIREKGVQSTYDIAMGGYDISGKKLDISGKKLDLAGEKLDLSGKKLSESTGASWKQLKDVGNVQRRKSNLAYSGTVEGKIREGEKAIGKQYALGIEDISLGREGIELGREDIELGREEITLGSTGAKSTYDIGMETSALGAEKGELDFMAGLRKQMNQMLIDYQGATGEAYGGGDLYSQLNTLFDQYSENV